jgi:hypothetical protein
MPIDFERIVDRAAEHVQRQRGIIIEPEARDVLVKRARNHEEDVENALKGLGLSEPGWEPYLEGAAREQFQESLVDPDEYLANRKSVNVDAVERGMKRKCHFVPWC